MNSKEVGCSSHQEEILTYSQLWELKVTKNILPHTLDTSGASQQGVFNGYYFV